MKNTIVTPTQNGMNQVEQKVRSRRSKSGEAKNLHDLFVDELKDIYWAEKALTKAIPKMIQNATSEELVFALNEHLEVTKEHIARLAEVFTCLDEKLEAKKCLAMEGIMAEAEEIMEDTEEGMVRDAAIISAAQKVKHYEIATYGTLCAFAKTLGEDVVADMLMETLNEEKEADKKLTEIAESFINSGAVNSPEAKSIKK
jgi:ferritin-like metal-binding protein YciE